MNYVFFEDNSLRSHYPMYDLEKLKNVKIIYRDKLFSNKLKNGLCRIHLSQKMNMIIKLPFKQIWYKELISNGCSSDEPICFVFVAGWYSSELLIWLKRNYNKGSYVLLFRDTISLYEKTIPGFNIKKLSNEFDLVITYDPEDAKLNSFLYAPVYISKIEKSQLPVYPESDVAFIGVAKDRLSMIHKIYEKLKNAGLKCDFGIVDVKKEEQEFQGEISYYTEYIPYIDYLGRESASNCLLEITKRDTKGNTYRCWEAVYYNKKLITNWNGIKDFEFYNPQYMRYIETVDDVDPNFILSNVEVDYNYHDENSPLMLLELIKKNIRVIGGN